MRGIRIEDCHFTTLPVGLLKQFGAGNPSFFLVERRHLPALSNSVQCIAMQDGINRVVCERRHLATPRTKYDRRNCIVAANDRSSAVQFEVSMALLRSGQFAPSALELGSSTRFSKRDSARDHNRTRRCHLRRGSQSSHQIPTLAYLPTSSILPAKPKTAWKPVTD